MTTVRRIAATRVGDTLDILGESAVWCGETRQLYWVDIRAPALRALLPETGEIRSWPLPDLCGAVVLTAGRELVLGLRTGLFTFEPATGALAPLLAPESPLLGNRINESRCDRQGRLWVGTMRDYGLATTGSLYRIDERLACVRVFGDITVPNALCWSPDSRRMYFADTPDGRLRAYDFDPLRGWPGAMRVLNGGGLPGRPDGATVDAEGYVWSARYDGAAVVRIAPDGRIDRIVDVPATRVTSCVFGGQDLDRLYITTARQKLSPDELARQPLAGALFVAEPGVRGLPEPRFRRAV